MLKKCAICETEFKPYRSTTRYCGAKCRKEGDLARCLKWAAENKDRANAHKRKWRELNPEKTSQAYKRCYEKRRRDPAIRLAESIGSNIRQSLKRQCTSKNTKTHEYLGCTGAEFAEYLVHHYAWKPDFTLENYGTVWHVDHIRPLASFDLTNEEEQKAAFHYTNCQPMRASDNMSKGSLWEGKRHNHGRD